MFERYRRLAAQSLITAIAVSLAIVRLDAAPSEDEPPNAWNHTRFVAEVESAGTNAFRTAVRAYDNYLAERQDVAVAVERCRLIAYFADSETGTPIASPTDLEQCEKALRGPSYANEPLALTYLFEQMWGEEGKAEGERLIGISRSWPAKVKARVYARTAWNLRIADDEASAGWHAVRAAELDAETPVLLMAARHLEQSGAKQRAHALLAAAPASAFEGVSVYEAAALLVRLGDAAAAVRMLEGRGDDDIGDLFPVATAMAANGQHTSARQIFASALKGQTRPGVNDLRSYFLFERDHGTAEQARSAYARIRERGFEADPFGRYRLALAFRSPFSSWAIADGAGPLAFAALMIVVALLPLTVVAPVHYLSLFQQVRGRLPRASMLSWRLGHAWYGMAGMLVTGALGLYIFAYPEFEDSFGMAPFDTVLSDDRALGRGFLFGIVALGLVCAPLLRKVPLAPLIAGRWPLRRSLGAATVLVLAFRFVAGLWSALFATAAPAALGSSTTRAMQGIYSEYGLVALLLVAAVIVPIVEELLFRGVLLNGLARHMSFWIAAIVQACVFALVHEELTSMPLIMVMGVMAAWVFRRSGGLAAPIALHMFNNALACFSIIAATRALDRV